MYYIFKEPNEEGYYGNPASVPYENSLKLPNELLSKYLETKGYSIIETDDNDIVTDVLKNENAYKNYIEKFPDNNDEKPSDHEILMTLLGVNE